MISMGSTGLLPTPRMTRKNQYWLMASKLTASACTGHSFDRFGFVTEVQRIVKTARVATVTSYRWQPPSLRDVWKRTVG